MTHATYWPEGDILEVRFCDKPILKNLYSLFGFECIRLARFLDIT